MPSVYRTALGKQIDIDKVRLQNENTVAVGNMRVNARGDSLDKNGQVAESKDERVFNSKQNKTYNSVKDEPIAESRTVITQTRPAQQVRDNTSELQATIEKLQRELAEKDAQIKAQAGKSLREAVADVPVVNETAVEEEVVDEVLTPTKTDSNPARGGLAAAIQKNMELQSKKTKPKRL